MRANSSPMPNDAPVMRAVLRSGTGMQAVFVCVGRTLLSAAFDFDFGFPRGPAVKGKNNIKIKIKSGGQECPPHTQVLYQCWFHFVDRMPRGRGLQLVVDVVDVLDAFGFQPLTERIRALLGVDRNTFFPGSASAENAIELHSG